MYSLSFVFSTLAIGCLSLPVIVQQEEIQRSIGRSSPGVVGGGVSGIGTGISPTLSGGRPLGGEIIESRRTASTTTRKILGKPSVNRGDVLGKLKEEPKTAAYIVGTGVIGTPVVVATPVVHTGLLHRSYPHVGVGIGRVDVTRTETNVITSGVY